MKKIFILYNISGQLGNRLQSASYFLAAVFENRGLPRLHCFNGYESVLNHGKMRTFADKIESKLIGLLKKSSKLQNLLKIAILHGEKQSVIILDSELVQKEINKSKIIIVSGYYIYSHPQLLLKHSTAIIEKLELRVSANDYDYLQQIFEDKNFVFVGIHIRHGDYREYLNGQYFFPVEHYELIANSIIENHSATRIRFIVCSDTPVNSSSFSNLDWLKGPGSILGDLYALSLCDFILGPCSTFNRWSAFWGNKPRLEIHKDMNSASLSDFKPQRDLTYPGKW